MDTDSVLMVAILPITYVIVDMLRPIPRISDWMLPMLAATVGVVLSLTWAWTQGDTSGEQLLIYGAFGFSFGAGATGANQIKQQTEYRIEGDTDNEEPTYEKL